MKARIARALVEEMIAHSREELPNEACGMVHAVDGEAASVHRVTNLARSPYRYEMAPLEMMRLEQQRDAGGERLFAIYHSHVASPARPSRTDVRMAFWPPGETGGEPMYPGVYYIVVSLAGEPPEVRAFHILRGGEVEERPLEVID